MIRASLILNSIREVDEFDVKFIWSGQHYSDNLKDVFFRELNVKPPDIELGAGGNTDAEISAAVITKLYEVLQDLNPEAAVFLGDTNTVMGCLAAAQLNIPIVHIEGCMRSYDWRMPEENTEEQLITCQMLYIPILRSIKSRALPRGLIQKALCLSRI